MAEYEHLRGDPVGALQQIWGEIDTALDLEMATSPRTITVLLEGLKAKCELGLASRENPGHEHEWVDMRNVEQGGPVESGEMCVKCHAIRASVSPSTGEQDG